MFGAIFSSDASVGVVVVKFIGLIGVVSNPKSTPTASKSELPVDPACPGMNKLKKCIRLSKRINNYDEKTNKDIYYSWLSKRTLIFKSRR